MTTSAPRPRKGYPLRLPPSLFSAIAAAAKKEHRTFNAQVTYILERWLEDRPGR